MKKLLMMTTVLVPLSFAAFAQDTKSTTRSNRPITVEADGSAREKTEAARRAIEQTTKRHADRIEEVTEDLIVNHNDLVSCLEKAGEGTQSSETDIVGVDTCKVRNAARNKVIFHNLSKGLEDFAGSTQAVAMRFSGLAAVARKQIGEKRQALKAIEKDREELKRRAALVLKYLKGGGKLDPERMFGIQEIRSDVQYLRAKEASLKRRIANQNASATQLDRVAGILRIRSLKIKGMARDWDRRAELEQDYLAEVVEGGSGNAALAETQKLLVRYGETARTMEEASKILEDTIKTRGPATPVLIDDTLPEEPIEDVEDLKRFLEDLIEEGAAS